MPHPIVRLFLLLMAVLWYPASPSPAQGQADAVHIPSAPHLQVGATRLSTAPLHIDGLLHEAVWASAAPVRGLVQRQPNPGKPAAEDALIRVLYDEEAIYVGMRLEEHDTDAIGAPLLRRDAGGLDNSDWAYVLLDSNDDNRTAFVFAVNPRGVQKDYLIHDDAREDLSWDAVWSAAARLDSLGWTAEFRIPLSQLRFDPTQSAWGVNFARWSARRGEWSFWAPWLPEQPGYVSSFGVLTGLAHLPAPRRLEIVPYVVGRLGSAPGDPEDPFFRPTDWAGSFGADLKYGLTSNLSLTATINPDFGQVEADPAEVNLTAFESFLSERRPFFVEGADIFDFGLSGGEQLFYSRRIGRAPQGSTPGNVQYRDVPEATTILGAAKISGRTASGWSVGVLSALTAPERARYIDPEGRARENPVEPLTNYGIVRVVRDFRDGESALGAVLSTTLRRIDQPSLDFLPSAALAVGLDGRHRFGGGGYEARGHVVGSNVRGTALSMTRLQRSSTHLFHRPDAEHLGLDPARTALGGVEVAASVARVGGAWRWGAQGHLRSPGFAVNDLGYQRETDRIGQGLWLQYRQFDPGDLFRRWDLRLSQASEWTFGRERVGTVATLFGTFELVNRWGGYAQLMRRFPALSTTELRGGPALRLPGYWRPVVSLNTDRRKPFSTRLRINGKLGDAAGDRFLDVAPSLEWRPSSQMELSLGTSVEWNQNPWQYVAQREVAGERHYLVAHLRQSEVSMEARVNYTFAPGLSLQFYAEPFLNAGQYDHLAEVVSPRAPDPAARFRMLPKHAVRFDSEADSYRIEFPGGHHTELTNPNYRVGRFRSNAVLRWEYRPGSALHVVWSRGQRDNGPDGTLDLREDLYDLFGVSPTDVLLVKLSHWISP